MKTAGNRRSRGTCGSRGRSWISREMLQVKMLMKNDIFTCRCCFVDGSYIWCLFRSSGRSCFWCRGFTLFGNDSFSPGSWSGRWGWRWIINSREMSQWDILLINAFFYLFFYVSVLELHQVYLYRRCTRIVVCVQHGNGSLWTRLKWMHHCNLQIDIWQFL